jgi:hypothetical protein
MLRQLEKFFLKNPDDKKSSQYEMQILKNAFLKAAENNQISIVKSYLDQGYDVNLIDEKGNTALHVAARNGNTELVKLLLRRGVNINQLNYKGEEPIDLALLNIGSLVFIDQNHHNLFIQSIYLNNLTLVKLIIEHTPVKFNSNYIEIVKLLKLAPEKRLFKKQMDALYLGLFNKKDSHKNELVRAFGEKADPELLKDIGSFLNPKTDTIDITEVMKEHMIMKKSF